MKPYGKELILDLHDCQPDNFTRENIKMFFEELCEKIDMQPMKLDWWDYEGDPQEKELAPPHLKGTTAVQFISTSNITIHTLDDLKRVYLNIFSCKDFDPQIPQDVALLYFGGKIVNWYFMDRL